MGRIATAPSFDDVIQGESGLAALNGGAGGEPRHVPMAVCDKICGYVLASAIGMALFHRERTGEGQEVHVPMLETMVAFNLVDHLWYGVLAEPEKGLGYPRMLTPHRRPFPTRDGHICILATTDAQSRYLFKALDCPELADDERFCTLDRRTENIDELYALIVERMRRRTTVSLAMLALGRALQGVGAAGLMSVNTELVRFTYSRRQLGRGIAMTAVAVSVSPAAGPSVASAILAVASRPWLFAIDVPIGLVTFFLSLQLLPYALPCLPSTVSTWRAQF
jgi:CoA transferase family III/MFS transporter